MNENGVVYECNGTEEKYENCSRSTYLRGFSSTFLDHRRDVIKKSAWKTLYRRRYIDQVSEPDLDLHASTDNCRVDYSIRTSTIAWKITSEKIAPIDLNNLESPPPQSYDVLGSCAAFASTCNFAI